MSSVLRTIFFTLVMIKYAKKNLEITKLRYTEQILPIPWPPRYTEVPLYKETPRRNFEQPSQCKLGPVEERINNRRTK